MAIVISALQGLLFAFYQAFTSWGLALILLAALVRLATMPLQKWAQNKERPGLLLFAVVAQMIIVISHYRMITAAGPLLGASFLWLTRLGAPDPYYVLPFLMMLVGVIQTRYQRKMTLDPTSQGKGKGQGHDHDVGPILPSRSGSPTFSWLPVLGFFLTCTLPAAVVLSYAAGGLLQLAVSVIHHRA